MVSTEYHINGFVTMDYEYATKLAKDLKAKEIVCIHYIHDGENIEDEYYDSIEVK